MTDRIIINAIRDILNDNLLDPRAQWTGQARSWVHSDNPLNTATFPRIQVRKRGPTQTEISSMGRENFLEWRILILDIEFWTTTDFKYDTGDGCFIKQDELVKEWLPKIWKAIKHNHTKLITDYGISGIKAMGEETDVYYPDTDKYSGILSVRVWEWDR